MTDKKVGVVALGGTFDIIHRGHLELLKKAFEIGRKVIIGISGDKFAINIKGKINLTNNYSIRAKNLKKIIDQHFKDANYQILELDTEYGPTITNPEIDALVTSQETSKKGLEINELRLKNGLKPLKIVVVDMIKAEDGMPISSSRIRTGHIDTEGKVLNFK